MQSFLFSRRAPRAGVCGRLAPIARRRALGAIALSAAIGFAACGPEAPAVQTPPPKPPPPPLPTAVLAPPTATASATPEPPGPPPPPPRLNVIVLSIDSLRADMPWAGYPRAIAPNLTAFEKKAVSYTRAYSVSSYTAMSFAGLLSGRYPSELDRSGFFFSSHPDSVLFFPETLQKAGIRTVAAQAHFYFEKKAGFHQGFDVWKMVPDLIEDHKTDRSITSPAHTKLALEILSDKALGAGDKPFFAWFHFMDPHDMYMPHDKTQKWGKNARDRYDEEVEFTDEHVGKILTFIAAQPWAKQTAIVITADHGEAFGEHKQFRHGFEVWENLVHVPLMVQAPGIAPRRIATPRSAVDLAPTIFEWMGVPAEGPLQGVSLVAEMTGSDVGPRDVIIDLPRTSDNDRRRAYVWGDYKLLSFGDNFRFELYNVVKDPGEKNDLSGVEREKLQEMKTRFEERNKTIKDICPRNTAKLKGRVKGKRC